MCNRFAVTPVRVRIVVTLAAALVWSASVPAQEDVPVVEAGSGDVEARLSRVERVMENRGLLDLANQVESLQREVQRLRGEVERQQHLIDTLTARRGGESSRAPSTAGGPGATLPVTPADGAPVTSVTNDPSASTTPPAEQSMAANPPQSVPVEGTEGPVTPPVQTATAAPAAAPGDPDQAYSAAFNALKAGKYDDAIAQFNNFLVTYPDSARADSAQYWLGEAYYVNKQYDPAINEYQKLVVAYPGSQKVSQAMLKIGFCQQELGQREEARTTLQEVVQRYPGTTSARMAEDRLQRMRLEQSP